MYVVLGQVELCDCIYMFVFLELNSAIYFLGILMKADSSLQATCIQPCTY